MSAPIKNKKAQNLLLLAAAALLVGAVVLSMQIEKNNPFNEILALLSSYGYTADEEDIYVEGEYENTTIQSVLADVDLTQAVQASRSGGFPSRIEQTGDVVLILLAAQTGDIITLYYLDGEPELCFVQTAKTHTVKPLGEGSA